MATKGAIWEPLRRTRVLPNSIPRFVRHASATCYASAISMQVTSLAAICCQRVTCDHVAIEVQVLCIGVARAAFGATLRSRSVSLSFKVKVCKLRYIRVVEHNLPTLVRVPSEQSGATIPLYGCQVLWVCMAKSFVLDGHGASLQE